MDRGGETSKGGYSDSGYLDGCERSSHRAPATESGHMSVEHMVSESSDDNGVDIIAPRKEDVMGKEFKTIKLAEEYYMSYAKGIGFSGRKNKLVRNSEGKVCRRRWCCSKEGLRNEKFNDRSNRMVDILISIVLFVFALYINQRSVVKLCSVCTQGISICIEHMQLHDDDAMQVLLCANP